MVLLWSCSSRDCDDDGFRVCRDPEYPSPQRAGESCLVDGLDSLSHHDAGARARDTESLCGDAYQRDAECGYYVSDLFDAGDYYQLDSLGGLEIQEAGASCHLAGFIRQSIYLFIGANRAIGECADVPEGNNQGISFNRLF